MASSRRTLHALAALWLSLAPCGATWAADTDELAQLRRQLEALRAENRALSEQLAQDAQTLERRIRQLELAKTAQEDAVRSIIRDSIATRSSKINEAAALGGTLDLSFGRRTDFSNSRKTSIGLNSADFELEIQTNEWAIAHIKLEYVDGSDVALQTATGGQAQVDRINLDTAYIQLGDQRRFPPRLTAGRMVLPFGISTGHPVADVLSTNSPLTVDAFEMRHNALGLNLAFPTPPGKPRTPPVTAPPVLPVALEPLLGSISASLGYDPPPARPAPLSPTPAPLDSAPLSTGLYVYEGRTSGGLRKHWGGTLGFSAKGHCGRRYEELTGLGWCPWGVNVDLGYNSSLFNSRFLETEYEGFLSQIGRVPGLAASAKASLGPFALVGEWNSATRHARFVDDAGDTIVIKPAAWQVSLGYQLGWNPWVQEIGAQGTYVAIGFSRSRDLAGAARLIGATESLVGSLPKKRLLLTAGEWVQDGLRVVIEYARDWDYTEIEGGTGRIVNGIFTNLTYAW
ncbi:MAG: hypothetical protein WA210_12070 [Burkholderiaceae bacterium]